ncbi:MAG: hypothetical protein IPL46_30580 [Saprospiraceae bacterium]|nr:hypothetical protein [Saprospiraceae bacterium]
MAAAAGSAINPTLYWSAGTDMRFATSTSNLGGGSYSEKFIFESDGDFVINPLAAGSARLTVFGTSTDSRPTGYISSGGNDSNEHALYVLARDGSGFSADVLRLATNRGLSSGYNYIQAIADEDGTPSYPFTVRGDGNVGIKTNNFGTSAAGVLAIGNGTAPSSSPTDQVQLFAADAASVSELKVRDEAGNVTTLSPTIFL